MCTENGADAVRSVAPARSCSRLTPRTVRLRRRRGKTYAGSGASGRRAPAGPAGFRAALIWRSRPPQVRFRRPAHPTPPRRPRAAPGSSQNSCLRSKKYKGLDGWPPRSRATLSAGVALNGGWVAEAWHPCRRQLRHQRQRHRHPVPGHVRRPL